MQIDPQPRSHLFHDVRGKRLAAAVGEPHGAAPKEAGFLHQEAPPGRGRAKHSDTVAVHLVDDPCRVATMLQIGDDQTRAREERVEELGDGGVKSEGERQEHAIRGAERKRLRPPLECVADTAVGDHHPFRFTRGT